MPTRLVSCPWARPGLLEMHEVSCLCVCARAPGVHWLWGVSGAGPRDRGCPTALVAGKTAHACLWNAPSPIKSSSPQMILPKCVLEHLSLPQGLLSVSGRIGRGRDLTGPPPSPGGDQPAPASLESGPSLPGTQKAEEERSDAAPGGGVDGAQRGQLPSSFSPSGAEGRVWGE